MGWASGSTLFRAIAERLSDTIVDTEIRKEVYTILVEEFGDNDCDTLDEVAEIDPILDQVLREYGYIEDESISDYNERED